MSHRDLMNYAKLDLPVENLKNHEELVEMIILLAQSEKEDEDQSLMHAIMDSLVQNLVESVQKAILKFKEEATSLFSAFFSKRQWKFTKLLNELNGKDFEKKIDETLAAFAREQRTFGANQMVNQGIQEKLVRKIQEAESKVERKMTELIKEIEETLNEDISENLNKEAWKLVEKGLSNLEIKKNQLNQAEKLQEILDVLQGNKEENKAKNQIKMQAAQLGELEKQLEEAMKKQLKTLEDCENELQKLGNKKKKK